MKTNFSINDIIGVLVKETQLNAAQTKCILEAQSTLSNAEIDFDVGLSGFEVSTVAVDLEHGFELGHDVYTHNCSRLMH